MKDCICIQVVNERRWDVYLICSIYGVHNAPNARIVLASGQCLGNEDGEKQARAWIRRQANHTEPDFVREGQKV